MTSFCPTDKSFKQPGPEVLWYQIYFGLGLDRWIFQTTRSRRPLVLIYSGLGLDMNFSNNRIQKTSGTNLFWARYRQILHKICVDDNKHKQFSNVFSLLQNAHLEYLVYQNSQTIWLVTIKIHVLALNVVLRSQH